MPTILGVESTAHTFGIGVVRNGKVLSNCKRVFTTGEGEGGMIPNEVAKFHFNNKHEVYFEALDGARIYEDDIDAIAFSQGPGLAPCLLEGMRLAKELAEKLDVPLVPVNHCIAHLEIGQLTGAKDPVMLYASGANTQIIAYASGKHRVFGETLDLGVGNFIDTFGRYAGLGFPAGPAIQKLAEQSKNYIELPYKVKGMDVSLSGILTNLRQKIERMNLVHQLSSRLPSPSLHSPEAYKMRITNNKRNFGENDISAGQHDKVWHGVINNRIKRGKSLDNYTLADLAYSLQETVFAMLVETAERALAHTGKKELLLGGGVACNTRLQEMCKIMCRERGAKFFFPENQFLVDNAGMIAFLGEIMFKSGVKEKDLDKIDIKPRERTDDVAINWRK